MLIYENIFFLVDVRFFPPVYLIEDICIVWVSDK